MRHGDEFVKHAEMALSHAKMAQKENSNPHIAEGVEELDTAITIGGMGMVGGGTKHAESAIMHLEQAK